MEYVSEDAVKLEELEGPLTYEQASSLLRLSYAQTYASCQGSEFASSVCLWDLNHKYFTMRHLFVGLSRAKLASDVSLMM